jgi:hypothetical protein
MKQLTPETIEEFLSIIDKVCSFEAQQYKIRGYGAFTKQERDLFPNPSVVEVIQYLKELKNA